MVLANVHAKPRLAAWSAKIPKLDEGWLPCTSGLRGSQLDVGALIIRIGFGGISYYNYNKEPPKPYSNY